MSSRYNISSEDREGTEVFSLVEAGSAVAEVAPSLGNNCFSLRAAAEVLEPVTFSEFRKKPTGYGIPILFPFPNRIRGGRFSFGGRTYTVDPPRHGFVRDKPWAVLAQGASDEEGAWITSSFDSESHPGLLRQYPSSFRLEVTYGLKDARLELGAVARNTGGGEMPVGFGIHPYFRKPARGLITIPARRRWELSDSLPTGKTLPVEGDYDLRGGRRLDGLRLDDIFTDIGSDAAGITSCVLQDQETGTETVVEFPAGLFPHVVVYTPPAPRQAICIEPNTCPTDAFNLRRQGVESNVLILGAGDSVRFNLRIYTRQTGSAIA